MSLSTQRSTTNRAAQRVRHRLILGVGAGALVVAGCGGTSGSEAALEQLIESQSGDGVDIDFGDGSFSVQTEEGEFSFDIGEDGSFNFDSDEGSGSFDISGDGEGGNFTFEGDDGTESFDIDASDDGFTVTGDDGEIASGDDTGFTITDEDGEVSFETSAGIPDRWPDDVPRPEGLDEVTGSLIAEGDSANFSVIGAFEGDGESYLQTYSDALAAAGFTETSTYSSGDLGGGFSAERDGMTISVNVSTVGDTAQVIIGLETNS